MAGFLLGVNAILLVTLASLVADGPPVTTAPDLTAWLFTVLLGGLVGGGAGMVLGLVGGVGAAVVREPGRRRRAVVGGSVLGAGLLIVVLLRGFLGAWGVTGYALAYVGVATGLALLLAPWLEPRRGSPQVGRA